MNSDFPTARQNVRHSWKLSAFGDDLLAVINIKESGEKKMQSILTELGLKVHHSYLPADSQRKDMI